MFDSIPRREPRAFVVLVADYIYRSLNTIKPYFPVVFARESSHRVKGFVDVDDTPVIVLQTNLRVFPCYIQRTIV